MSELSPLEIIVPETVEHDDDLADLVANDDNGWEDEDNDENTEDNEDAQDEEDYDSDDADDDSDEDEDGADEDDDPDEEDDEDDEEDIEVKETIESLTAQGDACAALLAKSNINYSQLVAEYQERGELSRESLNALEAAGYSEDLVTGYIEGQQAKMNVYSDRVQNMVGGAKEYAKLMKWAARNLTPKEIAHYDKAVESFDIDEARFAIDGLIARRDRAVGVKPSLIKGRMPHAAPALKGFSSLEEMAKAQDDPRYETDEAYTRMVERRMLNSNF